MQQENSQVQNKIFTIPNILSMFRIALIPFIAWAYFAGAIYQAATLVVLSALTDVVDGFIARHFNQTSALGKALDPIADKLTLIAIIFCICFTSKAMIALLVIFIVKEVIMGIEGLIIIKKTGTTYSARWYGKITTLVMYLTMLVHIVWSKIPPIFSTALIVICIAWVMSSFALYTAHNVRRLRQLSSSKVQENA